MKRSSDVKQVFFSDCTCIICFCRGTSKFVKSPENITDYVIGYSEGDTKIQFLGGRGTRPCNCVQYGRP